MMQTKLMLTLIAGLVTMGSGATAAYADTVTITLNSPTMTITPGGTVDFYGIVTAPAAGNSDPVYTNGDDGNFYGDGTIDTANRLDDPFLDNFFSIPAGGSQSGELFTVTIDSDAPAGLVAGDFKIYGGSTSDSTDLLGTVNFDVNVAPAASVTPEPPAWLLLATGFLGLVGLLRERRPFEGA
jgi:hypothetical protein